MRNLIASALLGAGVVGFMAATPAQAQASWLSEFLHRQFDPPAYYGGNYAPGYYAPSYSTPAPVEPYVSGGYYAPTYQYQAVPYVVPGRSVYVAPDYRYRYNHRHDWHQGGYHGHDHHGEPHGGHHGHHR